MKTYLLSALILSAFSITAAAEYFSPTNLETQSVILDMKSSPMEVVRTMADVNVGGTQKRYTAKISGCGATLTSIKIKVSKGPVTISAEGLKYSDGHADNYNFSQSFEAGYESSWIDINQLKSGGGCVTSVYVDAYATNPSTPSHVQVLGNFTK